MSRPATRRSFIIYRQAPLLSVWLATQPLDAAEAREFQNSIQLFFSKRKYRQVPLQYSLNNR